MEPLGKRAFLKMAEFKFADRFKWCFLTIVLLVKCLSSDQKRTRNAIGI